MSEDQPKGERIAKVMARSGVASRRDAEKMILEGRVSVNGVKVDSPALDVSETDKVTLDGKPIDAPQPARLWLYYKPVGLVTSAKDEKGRQTVFDTMPEGMPRVMSVGRLDLTSEGLLLLTNDGELKRKLELPTTGWLRKYRVRVNGRPNEATFDPLRRGVTIEGEEFQPMEITLDKQQGANAWLTVGLREGKNREIRRAMAEVGLTVNRLIRVSYGPFRLNKMKLGDVVEVKQRVLREQLGAPDGAGDEAAGERRPRKGPGKPAGGAKPRREGAGPRGQADKPRFARRDGEGDAPRRSGPARDGKRFGGKPEGERGERPARRFDDKPAGERGFARKPRPEGDREDRPARKFSSKGGEGRGYPRKPRPEGERSDRPARKFSPKGGEDRGYARKDRAEGEGGRPRRPAGPPKGPRRDGDAKPARGPRKGPGGGAPRGPRKGPPRKG